MIWHILLLVNDVKLWGKISNSDSEQGEERREEEDQKILFPLPETIFLYCYCFSLMDFSFCNVVFLNFFRFNSYTINLKSRGFLRIHSQMKILSMTAAILLLLLLYHLIFFNPTSTQHLSWIFFYYFKHSKKLNEEEKNLKSSSASTFSSTYYSESIDG